MDAADYAIQMASKSDSEIFALHVILSDVDDMYQPTRVNEIKQQAQKYLDNVREKSNDKKIKVRTELIASASVVNGIVGFAEKEDINLIIVGTRGKSGFKKLLLGSVASGVVTYAHCPVMVIK
jgi:nucleotide-binding universal stress UspA family protein